MRPRGVLSMRVSGFLVFSVAAVSVVSAGSFAQAQENFFAGMERRALATEAAQPHWATPLITTTPVLDQSLRADFQHGTEAKNATLWNLFGRTRTGRRMRRWRRRWAAAKAGAGST